MCTCWDSIRCIFCKRRGGAQVTDDSWNNKSSKMQYVQLVPETFNRDKKRMSRPNFFNQSDFKSALQNATLRNASVSKLKARRPPPAAPPPTTFADQLKMALKKRIDPPPQKMALKKRPSTHPPKSSSMKKAAGGLFKKLPQLLKSKTGGHKVKVKNVVGESELEESPATKYEEGQSTDEEDHCCIHQVSLKHCPHPVTETIHLRF